MKGLDMISDGLVGGRGQIVTGTSVTNEVGQNGGENDFHVGEFWQSTNKNSSLCTIDDLVGAPRGGKRTLK